MIKVLPKNVSDKIAAGEVIESPVSIVKELVENSIDAGATSITCEIIKGGKEEIRITDNGRGIPSKEVATAFLRHATSKISKAEDLKELITLGFRGEALASISAVSRTELITKTNDENTGTKIIIHGGNTISQEKIGAPEGTTIIVKDLFYNMPARAKFMKNEASEAGRIIDMMSKLAISRPDIKFSLISNGKTYFNTVGRGDLKSAIIAVYKDREYRELVEIKDDNGANSDVRVYGFISRPSFTRTNRRSQLYFVNGRPIKSKVLEKGVSLGYRERLFEGRYPIVFIFLDIEPDKVDVNVHPNKKEVRFNDEIEVIARVEDAIKNTLFSKEGVIKGADTYASFTPKKEASLKTEQLDLKEILKEKKRNDFDTSFIKDDVTISYHKADVKESQDNITFGTPDLKVSGNPPFDFDELEYGDTLFGTYIIAWDTSNFYLFDQHASHERVNYEKLVKSYLSSEKKSQLILSPFTFDIPLDIKDRETEWLTLLLNMGYGIESFGDSTYIVREIPMFMSLTEAEEFIGVFIDSYNEDIKKYNQIVIDKLITTACKSSIKAHDYIKAEEVHALIDDLKRCDNPFSCPHGRPTFIKFSIYDIERMFKRVN